jgi:hypothetical protein
MDGRYIEMKNEIIFGKMDSKEELRPECALRLECIRIASENVKASYGTAFDEQVLDYAEKLFQYITGQKKAA